MLATLLGSYTLLGLDSAANMAEETEDPRRVIPRATIRAVATAGGIGMVFLITLAVAVGDIGCDDGRPGAGRVHPRGRPRIGHREGLPLLHLCVDVLLRPDHHDHAYSP